MTTHSWKNSAKGFLYTAANYADGQAFVADDTLIVNGGEPATGSATNQLYALTSGTYLFNGGDAVLDNVAMDNATTFGQGGAGLFVISSYDQLVNGGNFDIGTPGVAAMTEIVLNSRTLDASFTNNGRLVVEDHDLKLFPDASNTIVTNSAGATITIRHGSSMEFQNLSGYASSAGDVFRNDGLIAVSCTSGIGSYITVSADYTGSGTLAVSGAPDDNNRLVNLQQDPVTQSTASFRPLQATINHFQAAALPSSSAAPAAPTSSAARAARSCSAAAAAPSPAAPRVASSTAPTRPPR